MSETFAYTIPRRANQFGRYVSQCFRNGKRYPAGNVDCGADRAAAVQTARQLILGSIR